MFEHLLHTNMRYFLSILMLHTKMLHTKIWYLSSPVQFLFGKPKGSHNKRYAGIDHIACRYGLFPNREIFAGHQGTYI